MSSSNLNEKLNNSKDLVHREGIFSDQKKILKKKKRSNTCSLFMLAQTKKNVKEKKRIII